MLDNLEDVNNEVVLIHKNRVNVLQVLFLDGVTGSSNAELDRFSLILIGINQCPETEVILLCLDTKDFGILGEGDLHIVDDGERVFPDSFHCVLLLDEFTDFFQQVGEPVEIVGKVEPVSVELGLAFVTDNGTGHGDVVVPAGDAVEDLLEEFLVSHGFRKIFHCLFYFSLQRYNKKTRLPNFF